MTLTKSPKIKAWSRWLFFNTCISITIYFGLWHNIDGAAKILQFYSFFLLFVSLFMLSDDFVLSIQQKHGLPIVPIWVDIPFDIMVSLALIWHGFFFSAAAFIIHMIFMNRWRKTIIKKQDNLYYE